MHAALKLLLVLFLLTGCSRESETGPAEVRWDRETCTRCAMAVSDRHHAAQVRGGPAGARTRVYKFDDIGCAVIWLDQQAWRDEPHTEIWVTDHRTGQWIDARTATYVTGRVTPMGYGLGAQQAASAEGMDFNQAGRHIHALEARDHRHGSGRQHSGFGE